MSYDREIARWLHGSKISEQTQHHTHLQEIRADEACDFLLQNHSFIQWYSTLDSQQLMLFGSMGSGKSVAMSYIIDKLRHRNAQQIPHSKICYYYCRDNESGRFLHILSTIILALLEQLTGLKKVFYEWYKENQASGHVDPANDTGKLQEFLEKVLATLDRPLLIIVDGLDECDRISRNRFLFLMKKLVSMTTQLKVLMSSRVQQEILEQVEDIAMVHMASDVERDSVIVRKIIETQIPYLSDEARALVNERLSSRAQGSAIWTKMVVDLIEVRGFRALGPLDRFLEEVPLPKQLSIFYSDLLRSCCSDDSENILLASTALKFLAVCRRPLGISELVWAVTIGVGPQDCMSVSTLANLVDHQRLMHIIHPFIISVDFGDLKKHQVQLIHQSVREFAIHELTTRGSVPFGPNTINTNDNLNLNQRIEILETGVLHLCTRYLMLDEIGRIELFSTEQKAIEELPLEIDLFTNVDKSSIEYNPDCTWEVWEENMTRYDPNERGFGEFFVYASSYWLEHFGAIKSSPFPDIPLLERLCQPNSTRINNWIQQNRRPGCVIAARFPFDSSLYDLLAITSLYGSEGMLREVLRSSKIEDGMYLHQSIINAADQILCWGDLSRLKILFLEHGTKQVDEFEFFKLVIRHWSSSTQESGRWDAVFDLVFEAEETMIQEKWGNELLCIAARLGCLPILRRLLCEAQRTPQLRLELFRESRERQHGSTVQPKYQSVGEAVMADRPKVLECLLQEDEIEHHLQHITIDGENVLHLASGICNPAIFGFLAPRLASRMIEVDHRGDTPLALIVKSSSDSDQRCECIRILFEHINPDDDCYTTHRHNLLKLATQLGDLDMIELLNPSVPMGSNDTSTKSDRALLDQKDTKKLTDQNIRTSVAAHKE